MTSIAIAYPAIAGALVGAAAGGVIGAIADRVRPSGARSELNIAWGGIFGAVASAYPFQRRQCARIVVVGTLAGSAAAWAVRDVHRNEK